jgi:hypothetical protein
MLSRRDTYNLALARSAEVDRQSNRMGTAALLHSPLSVTDRIRGVERQMLRMLRDAEVGIWPTLPGIFDAMAALAATAQIVDHGKTLDVSSSDEGETAA